MAPRLALVYTVGSLRPLFTGLVEELLPGVEPVEIVDETLLQDAIRDGGLTPAISARLDAHIAAVAPQVDAILVTCSSMGAAVESAAARESIPVLRVDEPMADEAVALGERVGVLATLSTTLDPTAELVARRASAAGRGVTVVPRLVEGAFDALRHGDAVRHDALVAAALVELARSVDVVVLAQASMARVAASLPPASVPVPVLSSPRSGVARVARLLARDAERRRPSGR